MTLTLVGKLRCWLFPFEEEAERKSKEVIDKIDALILQVRQIRADSMTRLHHEFSVVPLGADVPRRENTYVVMD